MPLNSLPTLSEDWFVRPNGGNGAYGIHGFGHTKRVWIHAMELADELEFDARMREALSLAAMWHDIGRTHDGADYYHGAQSAGKVVGLELHGLVDDPEVLAMALMAVTHHSGSEKHAERAMGWLPDPVGGLLVFRALKDADALDRVRFGGLDVSFLRFEESLQRVDRAQELLERVLG